MNGLSNNFHTAIVVASVLLALGVVVTAVISWRSRAAGRSAARGLAAVSLLAILAATVTPQSWPPERDGWGDLVVAPGGDSLGRLEVLHADPNSLAAVLVVLNVALFVPLAGFAVLGWGRPWTVLLVAVAVSMGIETVQLVALSRVAATDDVILNLAGAVLGIGLGRVIAHAARRRRRPQRLPRQA